MIDVRRIVVRPYRLAFRAPVVTAAGAFTHREGWHVGVEDAAGRMGWGDAAPWPGFGADASVARALLAGAIGTWDTEEAFFARVPDVVEAEAAYSTALCDLLARANDLPLWALGAGETAVLDGPGLGSPGPVAVHALVNSPDAAAEAVALGHRALKVKVGAAALDDDAARVAAIRAAIGPDVALRLDANGAWGLEDAVAAALAFAPARPAFIEQPCADASACAAVRRRVPVRVALDESLAGEADVHRALVQGSMDVAIIKPAYFRSWLGALDAGRRCLRDGVEVVVTCALESAVGRWAALHLAAALGPTCGPHGLVAPLAEDVGEFPEPHDGELRPVWCAGLGVSPP